MKYIFTGGGTAGHVNPAISMIEEIQRRERGAKILFIGRLGGRENRAVRERGIECREIEIRGIPRRISRESLSSLFLAIRARKAATEIIREFAPDVIVGTGGYVCWPVLSAAKAMKIPTALHESNIYPGLTARILSRRTDAIMINNESTADYLKRKQGIYTVGNPLRSDFYTITRKDARRSLGLSESEILIVSFGGSIGAERINECVRALMKGYSEKRRGVYHVHAAGERYYSSLNPSELPRKDSGCRILPYIDNMPLYLWAADLVICRCGAITLSEIALVGAPSILIPSPNVTDNHQYKNGKPLSDAGAALMISENELTPESLLEKARMVCEDSALRKKLSCRIRKFAEPNSVKKCVDVIHSLIK